MNVKDRQIALRYLNNITNSEYEPDDVDIFFHQLSRFSVDLFGFCLRDLLLKTEARVSSREKSEFVINLLNGKLHRNAILADDDAYERVENIFNARKSDYTVDISSPDFDKNFTLICDTFDLSDDSRRLLQFWVFMKKNASIRRLLCSFNDGINNDLMDDMNTDFVSAVCKIPSDNIKEIMSPTGPLVETGIIKQRYGDNSFSPMFLNLLSMNFNTSKEVRDTLIGCPLVANLKPENFDYISDDFDKISDILSGGIINNQTGVNILLYGRPGTGKTEIAKSICGELGLNLYTTAENQEDRR